MKAMAATPAPKPTRTPNAGSRADAAPVKVEVGGVVVLAPVLGIAITELGGVVVAWKDVVELVCTSATDETLVQLLGTTFVKNVGALVEVAGTNVTGVETLVVEFTARNVAKVGVLVKELVLSMLVSIAGIAVAGVEKTIGVVTGTVEVDQAPHSEDGVHTLQAALSP